jgi:hypothetical protein
MEEIMSKVVTFPVGDALHWAKIEKEIREGLQSLPAGVVDGVVTRMRCVHAAYARPIEIADVPLAALPYLHEQARQYRESITELFSEAMRLAVELEVRLGPPPGKSEEHSGKPVLVRLASCTPLNPDESPSGNEGDEKC